MNENSYKEDLAIKLQKFLRQNVSVIAMVLLGLVYIFYGIVTIGKTGKTVDEIIAEGAVSFLVGFGMKLLQSVNGLLKGELDPKFVTTKQFYLSLLDETASIQQYLPKYCDMENENALRRVQTSILRKQNLKYDDFINDKIDIEKLNKKQLKALEKARNVEIAVLNDAILLSDSQVTIDSVKNLNVSKGTHLKFSTLKTFLTMFLMAILFGVYGIDPAKGFDWYGAIWCAIQVAIYIVLGIVEYFNSYMFMADTYRTALVRKCNHLERFKNMYNENPERFKEKEEIKTKEKTVDNAEDILFLEENEIKEEKICPVITINKR